jgi:DNA polymerase I-like protein with 3'-5' exonuclease and polymerase domains
MGDPVINHYASTVDLKEVPVEGTSEYIANFIAGWQAFDGTDSTARCSRVVTTTRKDAALWLMENASTAGWFCTGASEHIMSSRNSFGKIGTVYYMIVLTKMDDMSWTIDNIHPEHHVDTVYCAEVDGLDEFTLQYGIYTKNSKFEDMWSAVIIGSRIKSVEWCTQMGTHIIDNRSVFSGLKFQTFMQFGIRPYDDHIHPYLESVEGSEFNRVFEAPTKDLMIYCGLDCIYGLKLKHLQQSLFSREDHKGRFHAFKFFKKGLGVMSEMQLNGVKLNEQHYFYCLSDVSKRGQELYKKLTTESKEARAFKNTYSREINIDSSEDLGKLYFEVLQHEGEKTAAGRWKTDKNALARIKSPFTRDLAAYKKLTKMGNTYLNNMLTECVEGRIHPFFDLHIPVTYRSSCIAGYERVFVMRDFETNPNGIPIKDIKVGDMVYCFDAECNPQIKKVTWQGKTGHREVIRVHYYRKGKKGYFDCTPEHPVRLSTGEYREAQDLRKGDRTLACSRSKDTLNFTGHIHNGSGIQEYRFIYDRLIETIGPTDVIHHIDGNHYNHLPFNLEKHTKSSHAKLHAKTTICSEEARRNNAEAIRNGWKEGKYTNAVKYGTEHPNWLGLTRFQCLKILAKNKGKIKIAADAAQIDFNTFKKYVSFNNINWRSVKLRYDKNGVYISKHRLLDLSRNGRKYVKSVLGHNHYRLIELYNYYGIDTERIWGNQFGSFIPGNHIITKVEWLHRKEDVYDIEVEEHHNFFVNEICVHNSSKPNFQNLPKRDPEAMKQIRSGIVPDEDCVIMEIDFSGAEVNVSCAYHRDQNFYKYLTDPTTDMHRDSACDILKLSHDELAHPDFTKEQKKLAKKIRNETKNKWVFAEFYGDWYESCGKSLYEVYYKNTMYLPNGLTTAQHMDNCGIGDLEDFLMHCKDMERVMWEERFPEYTQWKKDIYDFYIKHGYIDTYLGFRFQGYMNRKHCSNYPIQSTSFHLLVYTIIQASKFIRKHKLKTKLVMQIHDSLVASVPIKEINIYAPAINSIITNLHKTFKWMNVPMQAEAEITRPFEDGGNLSSSYVVPAHMLDTGKIVLSEVYGK